MHNKEFAKQSETASIAANHLLAEIIKVVEWWQTLNSKIKQSMKHVQIKDLQEIKALSFVVKLQWTYHLKQCIYIKRFKQN